MKTLRTLTILLAFCAIAVKANVPIQASQPNIVFFLIDDLGYSDWKLIMNPSKREEAVDSEATTKAKGKRKKNAEANVDTKEAPISKSYALYNLVNDISESNNLVEKEPQRVNAMRAKLAAMLKDAVVPGDK